MRPVNGRHPGIAWLLGWLVPGGGHLYLGQRARGTVLLVALTACFAAGVLLGGRATVSREHPEYLVLQWGAGLPAAAAWAAGDPSPADVPVSRREVGALYTLVPALLNLVAALDAAARAAGADPGGPHPAPVPPPPPAPAPAAETAAVPATEADDAPGPGSPIPGGGEAAP
jgi:hypothetical protein